MKTLKNYLFFATALCLTLSLSDCNKKKAPKTVTEPFEATAIGNYTYVGPDTLPNPKCTGQLSLWRAIVDGKGTGNPDR